MNDHNLHKDRGFFGIRPNVGPLKQRFIMPPYSTWNTRDGEWLDRRRLWLAKGIQSEVGRDEYVKPTYATAGIASYWKGAKRANGKATKHSAGFERTSVFDPVVCELAYGWWCPPGGVVLDPFAGGSVRGIVASVLGFKYFGIELRGEQVIANREQVNECTRGQYAPKWRQGDAYEELKDVGWCDFIFSCPPYGNLETYSQEPGDISNMTYDGFLDRYRDIVTRAVTKLRPNRFACFVVANYRSQDKDDRQMINFVGDTVQAFEAAGASFYNDIILINSVGTGAMRANTSFVRGGRKVVKCHQNILVFIKGDPKEAAKSIPASAGVETGEGERGAGSAE